MDDEHFARRLRDECGHGDYETAHYDADQIVIEALRSAGYTETAEAWKGMAKNWWWA